MKRILFFIFLLTGILYSQPFDSTGSGGEGLSAAQVSAIIADTAYVLRVEHTQPFDTLEVTNDASIGGDLDVDGDITSPVISTGESLYNIKLGDWDGNSNNVYISVLNNAQRISLDAGQSDLVLYDVDNKIVLTSDSVGIRGDLEVAGGFVNDLEVSKFIPDATWGNVHMQDTITANADYTATNVQNFEYRQIVNNPSNITSWGQLNVRNYLKKLGAGDVTTKLTNNNNVFENAGNGTVTGEVIILGVEYWGTSTSGGVTNLMGLFVTPPYMPNTDAVGTYYGVRVGALKNANIGTAYGIYQEGASDLNYFAGDIYADGDVDLGGDIIVTKDAEISMLLDDIEWFEIKDGGIGGYTIRLGKNDLSNNYLLLPNDANTVKLIGTSVLQVGINDSLGLQAALVTPQVKIGDYINQDNMIFIDDDEDKIIVYTDSVGIRGDLDVDGDITNAGSYYGHTTLENTFLHIADGDSLSLFLDNVPLLSLQDYGFANWNVLLGNANGATINLNKNGGSGIIDITGENAINIESDSLGMNVLGDLDKVIIGDDNGINQTLITIDDLENSIILDSDSVGIRGNLDVDGNVTVDSVISFAGNVASGEAMSISSIGALSDGEIVVKDGEGNVTIISPHPLEFDGRWMYMSQKDGIYTVVDWEKFITAMEKVTGEKYLYRGSLESIKKELK